MKALKDIPAVRRLAASIVWFEAPAVSLRDEKRFLVYAMTHATTRELATLRRHVSDRALKAALKTAPPGIMDKRSWAYWHTMLGRTPVPRMPRRAIAPLAEL